MIDYPALAAVAAIVREGSFERAAGALGITPSAISQRVRGLEERLGAILIIRGQPCRATDLGQALLAHHDKVRLLEADLAATLGNTPTGGAPPTVRIAVNADSLATWFPAAISGFARTGAISLDLVLDDEGYTADRLRSGEVLAAVTADSSPVPGCRTVHLGTMRYAACASPAFAARYFRDTLDAAALALAPVLRFNQRDRLQARWAKEVHGADLTGPVHWVPSTHAFLDLAIAGLAWGLQPVILAAPFIATGALVEIQPGRHLGVDLSWTVSRLPSDALARMTRDVCAAGRRSLEWKPA